MSGLEAAAKTIHDRGWLPIPLGLDSQGYPKKPIMKDWTGRDWEIEDVSTYPWGGAKGLGLVLGLPSHGLCAVDVDSEPLFDALLAAMGDDAPRCVRTARNRGHVYFIETNALSLSCWHEVKFQGEKARIELKSNGTQVAAPPTAGYRLLNSAPPMSVPNIEAAWSWLVFCLNQAGHEIKLTTVDPNTNRFPKAWRDHVPEGERDNSAFIEAHQLREAGMLLEDALDTMRIRWERHYAQGDQKWEEIEATINSAYRKGIPQRLEASNDLDRF